MKDNILLAYKFNGQGGVKKISGKVISKEIQADSLAWIHLDVTHPETKTWIETEISYLDPLIISALLADETRPRFAQIGDGVLLILRGVNLNENADPEDMISIRLWIDQHRIISVQKRQLKCVLDLEQKLLDNKGPTNSGEFICTLISQLFLRLEPILTTLDETMDIIEETLIDDPNITLRGDIIDIRKQALMFKRYMSPQKDALNQFFYSDLSWLSVQNKRHLHESQDRTLRYLEDLDTLRERAQIIKDELANILTDKMNKNMFVLSVIAAIFLPLGFLTGLLGINVGGIPGSENPQAFMIFCTILSTIILFQIFLFKKYKWF